MKLVTLNARIQNEEMRRSHEKIYMYLIGTIVSGGDWLGNPANIKVENNGAVGYVGSSLTVHNPLFSVHKL